MSNPNQENNKPDNIYGYGLIVSPLEVRGRRVYAELVPATPYLQLKPRGQSWRYYRPFGRSWKQPHIRWWFEVFGDDEFGQSCHYIEHDGGATTLRQAISKATDAVIRVGDELEDSK